MFVYIHLNIYIFSFVELYDYNATIADKITAKPHYYLPLCDEAAVDAQTELMEMVEDGSVKQVHISNFNFKTRLYYKITIFVLFKNRESR